MFSFASLVLPLLPCALGQSLANTINLSPALVFEYEIRGGQLVGRIIQDTNADTDLIGAYTSIGWGTTPGMGDKDVVMVQYNATSTECLVRDFYTTSSGIPPRLDDTQNLVNTDCRYRADEMKLIGDFTKDLNTGDANDRPILVGDDSFNIAWAYRLDDVSLVYHQGNRGSDFYVLVDSPAAPATTTTAAPGSDSTSSTPSPSSTPEGMTTSAKGRPSVDYADHSTYTFMAELDLSPALKFSWSAVNDEVLIGELSLSTANLNPDGAYVGLGFGDSPRMADKDMIIASIDGSGSCSVDAYYSTSQSAPSPQSMASTLMTGSQCMMADGVMTVRFAKTMDASSSPSMLDKDLSPTDSSLQVVYAYAGTPLTYHGPNRGANGLPLAQGALLADVVSAPGEGPSHSPTTSTTTTSPSSGYGASLGLGVLLATLCSLVAK